jgi:hypothetical protein
LHFPVPLLCGTLMMLSQIAKQLPDIVENFQFPDEKTAVSEAKEKSATLDIVSNLRRFDDDDDEERVFDVKTQVMNLIFVRRVLGPGLGMLIFSISHLG